MLLEKLNTYNIILGSASPRRKELLEQIGVSCTTLICNQEEVLPINIERVKIAEFLAKQKADYLKVNLKSNDILITADTIVIWNKQILNKPKNKEEAQTMLHQLSGEKHTVVTGTCLSTVKRTHSFSVATEVHFKDISDEEINYYITNYLPFDKAGAYGIQEWIGQIGIRKIDGSYSNVVGLPTAELYQKLNDFI